MKNISIVGAKEKNLKNITVEIPRNKLVLLCGVSGSGKSTLAIDVLYQECQRQYLEAIAFQGIRKPNVEAVHNVCAAIQISQSHRHKNPRSSIGTLTNIYTDLRMIYEKVGKRICPYCKQEIYAHHCKEEVVKKDADFEVFMYCNKCNQRMKKLTRSYFSYNTREGACPTCEGMGNVLRLSKATIIDEEFSLENNAIDFWGHAYKEYQIKEFYRACENLHCPLKKNTKVKDFTSFQRLILEYGVQSTKVQDALLTTTMLQKAGKFEGVFTTLYRRVHEHAGVPKQLTKYFRYEDCTTCHGERLQIESRQVSVLQTRLPELSQQTLEELYNWMLVLEQQLDKQSLESVTSYILDIKTKLKRMLHAGVGYLQINRQTMTLSGGESQRILLAAALDSDLTGMLYVLDEPTIGLHPKDTQGIIKILKNLRDKGNTILIIEHDQDIMKAADWMIDIGPGAGTYGGSVIAQGTYNDILK